MSPRPTAIVRRVWNETPKLLGVILEVSVEVATAYRRPGQVVVLHSSQGDKVYLAIASAVGEAQALELLVGPDAQAKLGLVEGSKVELDPPSGAGFALEMAQGKDVLVFAVGSGLAPIKALVEHFRRHRADYGRILLYVGAHTEEDFAYRSAFSGWKRDRIDLVKSVSQPWVQDKFVADAPSVKDAVAYVVGMKSMIEGVTEALLAAGMPKARIGKNW